MIRRTASGVLAALALLLGVFSYPRETAHAQVNVPVDTSVFPQGTYISYRGVQSSDTYDCGWALNCDYGRNGALPRFHTKGADQLGRTSGWDLEATIYTSKDLSTEIDWDVVVSFFKPGKNSLGNSRTNAALKDYRKGVSALLTLNPTKRPFSASDAVTSSYDVTGADPGGSVSIRVSGYATASYEVEAIAFCQASSPDDNKTMNKVLSRLLTNMSKETASEVTP